MSLLAALKNKTQPLAIAIPAIPATRKAETGGGIARIARIAVATETNQKNESVNDVDFSAWPLPTLDDEQQPLAIAIPAIPATRKGESGGGIARIARIAVATETNQKNESVNDVDFSAWPLPTLDDEQQPLAIAIAIPAIPATRKGESGGGIARIARIAVATVDTIITRSHVAGSDGTSCVFHTNEGALEYARRVGGGVGYAEAFSQAADFEDALQALAACGWVGVTAENAARAIADGTTDEAMLTSMLEATHD